MEDKEFLKHVEQFGSGNDGCVQATAIYTLSQLTIMSGHSRQHMRKCLARKTATPMTGKKIPSTKRRGQEDWIILGADFQDWRKRENAIGHRFNMRATTFEDVTQYIKNGTDTDIRRVQKLLAGRKIT